MVAGADSAQLGMVVFNREMWPYYVPLVVTLALITFFPALTTWIPRLAVGN